MVISLLSMMFYKTCRWIWFKLKYKDTYYTKEQFWKMIRNINPRQFEVFCCELYKALGYKAKITQATQDGGVDVVLKKGNVTTYVECKHYGKNSFIGREICQKLLGSCVMSGADKAIVFTTGSIHKNARECERKVGHLNIVGYDDIYKMFNGLDKNKRIRVVSRTKSYI